MERKAVYKNGKFGQLVCDFFNHENGLASNTVNKVVVYDGKIYFATSAGLSIYENGKFNTLKGKNINFVYCVDDVVFYSDGKTLFTLKNGVACEQTDFDGEIKSVSGKGDRLFLLTSDRLYKYDGEKFNLYFHTELDSLGIDVSADGKLTGWAENSLMLFPGKRKNWRCIFSEHSDMPEFKINVIKTEPLSDYIYLGTDKGLYIFDNKCGWYGHNEVDCFPQEEIYGIDFNNKGEIVLATEAGVAVVANGKCKYLPGSRWIPTEKANDVAFDGEDIWVATDNGVSHIYKKEMTLRQKADYYFDLSEKYYIREPGFATWLYNIENRDLSKGIVEISDNDGLWSHVYLGSLCYNYAVTKDERVRETARKIYNGCKLLTKITGLKGFTARAVRFEGDPGYSDKLDMQIDGGEWHKAPDGITEWLGETSSDEMVGHFFGFSLYYDFCADDEEKEEIKVIISDIVDHILEHNYRLHDIDGLPTTWACWAPDELNGKVMWMWEKGINSLEFLSFLDVAYHITGDEKYRKEFMYLAFDEHYLLNACKHKKYDGHKTHIDDNLGFLCSMNILRIEKDPVVISYIKMGLRYFWDYERCEKNPLWNMIFGVYTDDVCDIDTAVKALRDMPLDFINKPIYLSKRKDLEFEGINEMWGELNQYKEPLGYDERIINNYDSNPFVNRNADGKRANNFSVYLLPYWFGRYFGLIDDED